MGWFRSHARLGAWVAAVTLAIQLGLSFGHVHSLADQHPGTVLTLAANKAANAGAPQNSIHHDDDYCAICAVLAMLSGSQAASAPVVLINFTGAWVEQPTSPDTVFRQQACAAFRSRAPPQA